MPVVSQPRVMSWLFRLTPRPACTMAKVARLSTDV